MYRTHTIGIVGGFLHLVHQRGHGLYTSLSQCTKRNKRSLTVHNTSLISSVSNL